LKRFKSTSEVADTIIIGDHNTLRRSTTMASSTEIEESKSLREMRDELEKYRRESEMKDRELRDLKIQNEKGNSLFGMFDLKMKECHQVIEQNEC
jgi:hypothetical protein